MLSKLLGISKMRMVICAMMIGLTVPSLAQAGSPKDEFYQAYYAEKAQGNWEQAAQLYERVSKNRNADTELRKKARERLAVCQEELIATDFARLMPPSPIAYIEFSKPGEQLSKLLDQLGLLSKDDGGTKVKIGGKQVSISPQLIEGVLGMRGAAIAITGVDLKKGEPTGVAILHAGNMDIIRGLIETGLPIGGTVAKPIGGYPTYMVDNEAVITLTSRLVITSPSRALNQGVVDRLTGVKKNSLASNEDLAEVLKRRDDSLLFFCINAKPIMPMINGLLAAASMKSREAGVARAILDLNSLQTLVGRLGVEDDGISFDLSVRLDEQHHNLAYNFFRMPAVSRDTLARVPKGAAAFLIGALNEASLQHSALPSSDPQGQRIVTLLDFGREIFANITSYVLFVMPPADDAVPVGLPIPDVAFAMTVHDTERSSVLWSQMLGIASMASTGSSMAGQHVQFDGAETTAYKMPEGVTVYLSTVDHDVVLATTKSAMKQAIFGKQKGHSILDDQTFAKSLSSVTPSTTQAFFVHPGRMMKIASRFMPEDKLAELEPVLPLLDKTVISFVTDHSGSEFHMGASLTGIPKVGGLVTQLVEKQMAGDRSLAEVNSLLKHKKWATAASKLDGLIVNKPGDGRLLFKKFKALAANGETQSEANECGQQVLAHFSRNANTLNTIAWGLLTKKHYRGAFNDLALKMSQRSNELTGQTNWMFVDTLARAKFKTGDIAGAIELQKKALLLSNGEGEADMKKSLVRFESAAKKKESLAVAIGSNNG